MKFLKISLRWISALIFIVSIGLIVIIVSKPTDSAHFQKIDKFLSTVNLRLKPVKNTSSSPKASSALRYHGDLELQILENIKKDPVFYSFCVSKVDCNFNFSFSSDIPITIQTRIKQLVRTNYPEQKNTKNRDTGLLIKFEVFTSKKDPYLQTPKKSVLNSKITNVEDLFLEHQNNESLLFQLDYYRQSNKIQEIAFKVSPASNDFGQKKTR